MNPVRALEAWLAADDPEPWVVETSGSTGQPKRVLLPRAAVLASVEASAYPGFFFCYGGQGDKSPIVLANTLNTTAAAFNASCTFTFQSPGLTGAPGSFSLAVPSLSPPAFVSWFGGGTGVTAQAQQAGNPTYANMTTWTPSAAGQQNWPFPPFSFVARGSAAAVTRAVYTASTAAARSARSASASSLRRTCRLLWRSLLPPSGWRATKSNWS